ncbi:MAG TPA: hypothetical protein VJ986_09035 [Gaiellaceae bacterium]|nr:hypothetical protein [Gaiellaceae bacterium]
MAASLDMATTKLVLFMIGLESLSFTLVIQTAAVRPSDPVTPGSGAASVASGV